MEEELEKQRQEEEMRTMREGQLQDGNDGLIDDESG